MGRAGLDAMVPAKNHHAVDGGHVARNRCGGERALPPPHTVHDRPECARRALYVGRALDVDRQGEDQVVRTGLIQPRNDGSLPGLPEERRLPPIGLHGRQQIEREQADRQLLRRVQMFGRGIGGPPQEAESFLHVPRSQAQGACA